MSNFAPGTVSVLHLEDAGAVMKHAVYTGRIKEK